MAEKGSKQYLTIACVVITVISLIYIINIYRPKSAQDSAGVVTSLKYIHEAARAWGVSHYPQGFYGITLPELAKAYPSYIDDELAKGIKDGYSFFLFAPSPAQYFCIATPLSSGASGTKVFRISELGIVEADSGSGWVRIE